ncbi:transmembrane and death domain protein 1-like isoform X2 [Syngnathoides biaculeatus]|uniref:transmembrane and death domain protein 1-like isoform X2 n=1 Tax=Syngnathoides biaculeatus TaxID=300417 RepID=UPI002ADDA0A0|nr:transmembrane and death domain protein 1-like isoform X2 [Syngnathoides biaculeatus]
MATIRGYSAAMHVCRLGFLLVLFALGSALEEDEDTVAEELGAHQLERLVELLTPSECEDLLDALSQPEEKNLERIVRRATSSLEESEAKCRKDLRDQLQKYGGEIYFDRLTRALHHIDRTDIAVELGKNINQDTILNLKRYAEAYHEFFKSVNTQEAEGETSEKKRRKRASDLTWRDLDLIVERPSVPAYSKGPLDVALPILYGILLGFGGTLLAAVSTLYAVLRISRRSQQRRQPRVTWYPGYEVMIEN